MLLHIVLLRKSIPNERVNDILRYKTNDTREKHFARMDRLKKTKTRCGGQKKKRVR